MKVLGGLTAIVLVIGLYSCGSAFNKSEASGKQAQANISSVHLGMTKSEVIAVMGKPESGQQFNTSYGNSSCIYYGTFSSNDWQLCFDNGRLTSKNHY
jgi:hypothetical protein